MQQKQNSTLLLTGSLLQLEKSMDLVITNYLMWNSEWLCLHMQSISTPSWNRDSHTGVIIYTSWYDP